MEAEGWCTDPYRRHEERWFSAGEPTDLVRDGEVESRDPPPDLPPPEAAEEAPEREGRGPDDLRRAGAEEPVDEGDYDVAAMDGAAQATWGLGDVGMHPTAEGYDR